MATVVHKPAGGGPHPAIIVIQEVFGVNANIDSIARRFASEGYVAAAPDMFYRTGKGQIIKYGDMESVGKAREGITDDGLVNDVEAVRAYLTSSPGVANSPIGITGYCFGGRVSFLAACRVRGLSAAAVYYGGGIVPNPNRPQPGPAPIESADQISCPVIGFFGDQDQGIPKEHVDQIRDTLNGLGKQSEIIYYPGAGHGFFCDDRESFHQTSADDSWGRVLAFFEQNLKGAVTAG